MVIKGVGKTLLGRNTTEKLHVLRVGPFEHTHVYTAAEEGMDAVITESRDVKAMIAGFERQTRAQYQELMTWETRYREQGAELISVKAKLEDGERRMTAKEREIKKKSIRSDADTMRKVLLAHNIVLGKDGHYETMEDGDKGTKKQLKEKELMNNTRDQGRTDAESCPTRAGYNACPG